MRLYPKLQWRLSALALLMATLTCSLVSATPIDAAKSIWQGTLPAVGREFSQWSSVLNEFKEKGFYYGAMAGAQRVLITFPDVQSKEAAFRVIVELVDKGYPNSVIASFLPGDLVPGGDYDFVNNYNLYKFILNQQKGNDRWAKFYLQSIDQENFPKYLFLQALQAYSSKDYKTAEEKLRKILARDLGRNSTSLVTKSVRTLARVYFDQDRFQDSLDLYTSFLLKRNPVIPTDWVEAAWCLYHLKRYPEALGMLYNMESRSSGASVNLEKYTVRALSYRNLCAIPQADTLIESYDREFGNLLTGIRMGESLSKFPQLARVDIVENEEYKQVSLALSALLQEQSQLGKISQASRPLATFIYSTEIRMLARRKKSLSDAALERASSQLVMTREHLRFLKFDIQREMFNPETVFAQKNPEAAATALEDLPNHQYRIHWRQFGDFWRDERLKYQAVVENQCPK